MKTNVHVFSAVPGRGKQAFLIFLQIKLWNSIYIKDFCWCIGCRNSSKLLRDKIAGSLMLCLLNKSIKYIDPEGPMFTDADTKDEIPNPIPISIYCKLQL